jgi:hypothetical protein
MTNLDNLLIYKGVFRDYYENLQLIYVNISYHKGYTGYLIINKGNVKLLIKKGPVCGAEERFMTFDPYIFVETDINSLSNFNVRKMSISSVGIDNAYKVFKDLLQETIIREWIPVNGKYITEDYITVKIIKTINSTNTKVKKNMYS